MAKRRGRPPRKQSEGLGDTLEKITKATGIKKAVKKIVGDDCGCEERKRKLNEAFSYRIKVVNCPTDADVEWYRNFKETRTLILPNDDRKKICELYSRIFNVPYYEPCINCAKPYITMIDRLDKAFEI